MLRPEDQRTATSRAQYLFRRPQCVRRFLGLDQHDLLERQTDVAEPEAVRHMRRLQQRNAAAPQPTQRRPQQTQLAHPGLLDHQVDQRAYGPAAPRQFRRQRGIAGLHRPPLPARQLGRAPERRVHLFWTKNGS